ncbi:MAG: tRNA pseudouridine(54/55) synthase Pus10 [Candidatus Freyarchaeota archaeon]|nr:tRNA pseudouridine(54/55) synthase Pus10 [Candidatus Freyrarchaeum guaymaensis]
MYPIVKALEILKKIPLCNSCLGRQFALLGMGSNNPSRGHALKLTLTMTAHYMLRENPEEAVKILKVLASNGMFQPAVETLQKEGIPIEVSENKCYICGGLMLRKREIAQKIASLLENYDYRTLLIGCHVPIDLTERDDEVKAAHQVDTGESLKAEFNREVGKIVSALTGKPVDFKNPDIVAVVNLENLEVTINSNPIYIGGRYLKYVRGIPQTKWPCKACKGQGCPRCGGTGKMYPESVEELVTAPILEETGGEEAKFHGAGREDIDARMLGTGRPFIVEVKNPKKRNIDLQKLQDKINQYAQGKVEVHSLHFAVKEQVRQLKALSQFAPKTYKAIVKVDREITSEELKALEQKLTGQTVRQKTPRRVAHRRAVKTRLKKVYEAHVNQVDPHTFELIVKCQGGLYVKELVTGDRRRTRPSVSEILNAKAECTQLDVIDVGATIPPQEEQNQKVYLSPTYSLDHEGP